MERRRVLQILALGSAGSALGWGATSVGQALAEETGHHWGYVGETGPRHWAKLAPDFQVCGLGQEQSPIDLQNPISAPLSPPMPSYRPVPLRIINNGFTIQVNIDDPSNILYLDGKPYTLRQFHFHHPSEHTVAGAAYPMEIHLVHTHADGSIVVLGVFITAGAEQQTLRLLWDAMAAHPGEMSTAHNRMVDPSDLLPRQGGTFRYVGSLTTPPCSETVDWIVFQTPIEASREQLERFGQRFAPNARPVQPPNRRRVLASP